MDSDKSGKSHSSRRGNAFTLLLILSVGTMLLREAATKWPGTKAIDGPPQFQSEVNVAPVQELQLLPKIGKTIAESLVIFRKERGPLRSAEDLRNIRGLGANRSQELQGSISFAEQATPPSDR
jgi:Helix-hairpin-helix motif